MAADIEIAGLDKAEQAALGQFDPLRADGLALAERAEGRDTIATDDDLKVANEIKKDMTSYVSKVKNMRLSLTRPLDAFKKSLMNREEELVGPVDEAKRILVKGIIDYEEEKARIIARENQRLDNIVNFIDAMYRPGMTKKQVEDGRAKAKKYMGELSDADKEISRIKLSFMTLSNCFTQRMTDIEIDEQRAKKQKLQDDEAKLEAEKREIAAAAERQALEKAQIEADKAAAKAERERPKSNIVEMMKFEIVDADLVDRKFCSPDERLIRAYLKENPDGGELNTGTSGVKLMKTKVVR